MNLVMSDITRNKLGCYMAQQASLNNIPVTTDPVSGRRARCSGLTP